MDRQKPEDVTLGKSTVRVYHRKTRDLYDRFEVADYSAGKRVLRSFSDRDKARAEATRIARLMASGEAHAAQMTGKEAASYGRAVELLKPTGVPLELAAARYADAWTRLGGDRLSEAVDLLLAKEAAAPTRRSVVEAVQDLLAARAGRSTRYLADLKSKLGRFAEAFTVDIGSVTGPDIQHWLDGLKATPVTVKGYRTVLHLLFAFAETRGFVPRGANPVSRTERVKVNGGDIEIYTPGELAKLLAAATPEFIPVLAIQAFAGLRSAEVERLTWEDVDLAGGHIKLTAGKAKTAMRRIVAIADNLRVWLADCPYRQGLIWKGTHPGFYAAQELTARKAGIKWKANALRHSFVSYRLAVLQDVNQVALEAGNSPGVIFRHYRELVTPKAGREWFAITPEDGRHVQPSNSFATATRSAAANATAS